MTGDGPGEAPGDGPVTDPVADPAADPGADPGRAQGAPGGGRERVALHADMADAIDPDFVQDIPEHIGARVGTVVVVGAANMDLKARSNAAVEMGTSNPGTSVLSAGGVGRNIAENLARLGSPVHLVSVVGDDPLGDELLAATAEAGVDVTHVRVRPVATGTYAAILTPTGDLVAAIADIASADHITPLVVRAARDTIARAAFLIVEGNLSNETIATCLDEARLAGVPVLFDPVSAPKARRIAALLSPERPFDLVTPNREELAALTGVDTDTDAGVHAACRRLHELGVDYIWVRLGVRGSLLSAPGGTLACAAVRVDAVDVTGAGDAMLAAYCHARLRGDDPLTAVRYGHAAAALTVQVHSTVRQDLSDALVRSLL